MAMADFADVNITDRDERLLATTAIVGHPVNSWNDLTRGEASTVIDTLEKIKAGTATWDIDIDGNWRIIPTDDELLT